MHVSGVCVCVCVCVYVCAQVKGVHMSDGDLTIPLLSMGGMCQGGWRGKRLNPARMKIVTKVRHA